MKKLILAGIFAIGGLTATANAQIQKGNWLVGSSLLSSNFGLNTGGGYNISIQPKGAYFIEDNVAVGGYVNLGISKVTNGSPTRFDYAAGGLGRYYLSPGEKGVDNLLNHGRWFFEGNVGIGGSSVENGNSTTGLDFGVGPGYSYFITPNIGLEGLVKYQGQAGFGNEGLNSNITFNVGFSIYIPTSKAKQVIREAK
ncbi:porin family protein [Chryseobacterium gwangjuense]|uniref:porin family protein n=1 Tax=Chryseobacterium gwangjuense TaxID=1069980 RepID=UPI001E39C621|nr:porin family protein [Chryseobacterium gwangjuense]MCE3076709.1 porin family protein [Chryseobacterium gwangjuense]